MAAVATGRETENSGKAKTTGSDEGTEPSSAPGNNANTASQSGGSQQANSQPWSAWDQPPPTNAHLLTPQLANAFGIQMMNGYRYPAPPPNARPNGNDSGNGGSGNGGSGNGVNSGNATQSQPTPHYAGATEHHPPGIPPPGYPAFPHPGMHSSPNAANANAQAAAAAAAMAAASAMGSPFGFHGMPFPQHYAAQARAPAGHYAADMYGRSRGDQQVMPPPPGHQMDPSVSFEHMMAYQASVEHSRSFAAFKRSREDPAMQMQMGMDGGEEDHAQALKRPRLVWTPPLHKRFVDAVAHLGIKNAVPKTIMQLMNVEGLTRENVASHLQKYRLYVKRLQGCSESTMENSPSREGGGSGGGSDGAPPAAVPAAAATAAATAAAVRATATGAAARGTASQRRDPARGTRETEAETARTANRGSTRRRARRDLRGIPRGPARRASILRTRAPGARATDRERAPAARVAGAAGEGAAAEAEGEATMASSVRRPWNARPREMGPRTETTARRARRRSRNPRKNPREAQGPNAPARRDPEPTPERRSVSVTVFAENTRRTVRMHRTRARVRPCRVDAISNVFHTRSTFGQHL